MTLKFSIIGVRINEKCLGTECIEVGNGLLQIKIKYNNRVKGGKSDIFHYDPFLSVLFKNNFYFFMAHSVKIFCF